MQHDPNPVGEGAPAAGAQPVGSASEASENTTPEYLWEHRPRLQKMLGPNGWQYAEPMVCRLPNGGMSPGAQKQLAEITARRDADKRLQEQQAQADADREL